MKQVLVPSAVLWLLLFSAKTWGQASGIYMVQSGRIGFFSSAPKELIEASSNRLKGVVDLSHRTFAFKIPVSSFVGFNSPLQQEHFNENYMETASFADASFSGKIIEDQDFSKDGIYEVRAKGRLNIHGVLQERIVKVLLTMKNHQLNAAADFTVLLSDHAIKIPRVVYNKLAAEINVSFRALLMPRS